MIDSKLSSTRSSILQDPEKRKWVEYLKKLIRQREKGRSEQAAVKPNQLELAKIVNESSTVHAEKQQQPASTNEVTAEIVQLYISDFQDDNTYTIVENYCLDNPNIGGREMAVYAMLARHCHMPKRTCKVSLVRLSEKLGWKRDTINKALDNLTKFGLIERGERENGGAYTYTLTHRHRSKKKEKKAA